MPLVPHHDVWLVRVSIGVEDISVKSLILIKLVLTYDLVLNTGISEALGQCLHDALLEGVVLGGFLGGEADLEHVVPCLQA